jgi:hypothetical protein
MHNEKIIVIMAVAVIVLLSSLSTLGCTFGAF